MKMRGAFKVYLCRTCSQKPREKTQTQRAPPRRKASTITPLPVKASGLGGGAASVQTGAMETQGGDQAECRNDTRACATTKTVVGEAQGERNDTRSPDNGPDHES